MNIITISKLMISVLISMLLLITGVSSASEGDRRETLPGLEKARSGTVVCGGFYFMDRTHRSRWILRNVNDEDDITIDRMRIYNKRGEVLFDSLIDPNDPCAGLLPGRNGILGPGQCVLGVYQTARYRSEDLPPFTSNPRGPGHVMVIFDWSAEKRIIPLAMTTVRYVYDPSLTTVVARSTSRCTRTQ